MSIDLPNSRVTFIPQVPQDIQDASVKTYLGRLKVELEGIHKKAFDNADAIRSVINTGTSGTFVDSDGNTITVTDGLITSLT